MFDFGVFQRKMHMTKSSSACFLGHGSFPTEAGALDLLISRERMRIFLSLPSKSKAPASVHPLLNGPYINYIM